MAHIADLMVHASNHAGLNNLIARELSPDSSSNSSSKTNLVETAPPSTTSTPTEEKERYVWRMHQPSESRKFTLFPVKDKLASIATGRKAMELEHPPAQMQNQAVDGKTASRKKEQTLVRRRKVSVPELGPMTTVQEVAMDSPTIPGRPPLHERSISAPGNSWRQHMFGENMISVLSPALDENAEIENAEIPRRPGSTSPKLQSFSPKALPPLVIPSGPPAGPRLRSQSCATRLRSDSGSRHQLPPDVPPKSARMNVSPHPRGPFTPLSSTTTLVETPASGQEGRQSPKPWANTHSATQSPKGHNRGQSEAAQQRYIPMGHRRGESESSVSIMDRGRPKKRSTPVKRSLSKRSPSSEAKAFETLPQGFRPENAGAVLPHSEIDALRKQAMGQASRFDVLNARDVDILSRELRALDERCDYLRKTHKSLRSGRRNLHDRICSYLRSPRVARFSHESILKQEEALSELDTSIDDWATKLEYAENRRTRVRQKLLEHVAAALLLPATTNEEASQQEKEGREHSYEDGLHTLSTPPRSPTKSHSPQRLAEPVPVQVESPKRTGSRERRDVQSMASIKIYADSDVYALLADVEEEITRMGDQQHQPQHQPQPPPQHQYQKKQQYETSEDLGRNLANSPDMSEGHAVLPMMLQQRTYNNAMPGFL